MDNAICGGAGSTLTGNALKAVKAAIFMGDPHNRNGLPYNVGTCKAQGVSPLFLQLLVSLLTSTLVRRPPCWIHLRTCQQQHHPELLRLCIFGTNSGNQKLAGTYRRCHSSM